MLCCVIEPVDVAVSAPEDDVEYTMNGVSEATASGSAHVFPTVLHGHAHQPSLLRNHTHTIKNARTHSLQLMGSGTTSSTQRTPVP